MRRLNKMNTRKERPRAVFVPELYQLARKCPVETYGDAIALFSDMAQHKLQYLGHTVEVTRGYFYCCGKKYPRGKPREVLDHLFTPLTSAPELISVVDNFLPLPIAEEIIPHLPALPARCYLDRLVLE